MSYTLATGGLGVNRISMVRSDGVVVDSTSAENGDRQRDGRLFTFIPYVPVRRYRTDFGPPEHTDMPPDKGRS